MGYLSDRREIEFFLWELFRIDQTILGQKPFHNVARVDCEALLDRARAHAQRLSDVNRAGDRDPATLMDDGTVRVPQGFADLWSEHRRDWSWLPFQGESILANDVGERFPHMVLQMVGEMFAGANPSFMTYGGFTTAAFNLIRARGTEGQKELFCGPLRSIRWDACFCATEAEAGSDLSAIKTEAEAIEEDAYAITGEKKYITAGYHELTENTVYLVLGRIKGAKKSSLSMSCFIVPRYLYDSAGTRIDNNVRCKKVEDKMGLRGCANTHLTFGASGTTRGFLLGNRPNVALLQLAMLMRRARIGTGAIALAASSSAYLHSLEYARARIQGALFDKNADPSAERVAIIRHLDVQRMLLEMRSKVEGCRSILGRISWHSSIMSILTSAGADQALAERHARLALLLSPIAKAYISDEAWKVVTLAMQIHGAVGYLADKPLEQYLRDIKILTIWEGTNYIQAQDLVRDKLGFGQALVMKDLEKEIFSFLETATDFPNLAFEFDALGKAFSSVQSVLEFIGEQASRGDLLLISQFCTRFLEMFGEVLAGWGVLQAASIAAKKLEGEVTPEDRSFYSGKLKTARFFMHNIIPNVAAKAGIIRDPDKSYVAIASEEFGYHA
jgi:acyl-CoA dehydrogenase